MLRVVTIGAAVVLSAGLMVGCDDDSSIDPFGLRTTSAPGPTGPRPDGPVTDAPVPPPSPDRPVRTSAPPTTRPPTATARPGSGLTAAQAKILVAFVALTDKDWGPEYVPQEQNYELTGLDYAITGADCKQAPQGTVPGGLATMGRYVYVPTGGKPSIDNLSKTLATSSATAYASVAQARAEVTKGVADARRCPTQTLTNDEKLSGIEVFDLAVPGIDEIHIARASWNANHGGAPFQYVWVTARQGQVVLTAAVVDRSDKTFESAKKQAIDAIAVMVTRTDAQLR
ncbi:hypothetical protein [Streptomyces sp. SID3343]|uniref:hypothetical protein n=1 Tax=Streptomyces sp. SID3343 TaxID=2690260 RepID=UPI00136FA4E9|nr:hypothetical protein [Streptomyces sp. SID3343]MYW03884.1 hypothetical protein [Streptomyces sp. SID3343]